MPNSLTVELPAMPDRALSTQGAQALSGGLPLRGITILAVEDSRFASEALRLMCQRLGARLRRAETIQAARSHLRLYRPDVVIVDLGLPDGRGEALIREVVLRPNGPVVLGTSGDAAGRALALAAGAEGYVEKPLESLQAFATALLRHLPDRALPAEAEGEALVPDRLALRDDLARAADLIDAGLTREAGEYLAGFLSGVAAHAHDQDLAAALRDGTAPDDRLARLRPLLDKRLSAAPQPFAPSAAKPA